MREFWRSVDKYIRSSVAWVFVALGLLVTWIFQDQLLQLVYRSGRSMGLTPDSVAALAAANPLISFFGVVLLAIVFILLFAWRDVRRQPIAPPSVAPSLPVATPQPSLPVIDPPPSVSFVACEVDVPLMYESGAYGGYNRLPADGKLVSGVVAAFRQRGDSNAIVTAHIRYVRDGEVVHAHAGAWVGGSDSSFTLGNSHVGELVLAVDSTQVYCYAPDVVANGVTLKKLSYGRWVAEVELDIRYGESARYVFDLVLVKNHSEMRASLRPDPHP